MARAGFCAECQANVWLTEDGRCSTGHRSECISGIYDVETESQPADAAPQNEAKRRRWWPWVIAALLVLLGCGVVAATLLPRFLSEGAGIADEWRTRLAADYPGWTPIGFNVRTFQGSGGPETTYQFTLVPPNAEFSIPVVYVAIDGGPPESQDEILRPAGRFHERSDSLLGYISGTYYAQGKSTLGVTSDASGDATVHWVKVNRFGPFNSRYSSFDELTYNELTGRWSGAQP